ncbi:MAG: cystathionine gamma-synthase [Bdellovibrionaceae bacterium]|nr:cystathionine gamma-synthase [Pseudobdellovibrionaceae bacterium]
MKNTKNKLGFSTRAIHAGQEPDKETGAVMTPVYMSSTFVQKSPGKHTGYEYSRTSNPTRKAYEDCLASLEGGCAGFALASGSAATSLVLHLLKPGDHIIAGDDMYGGTFRLFDKVFKKLGLEFSFVDLSKEDWTSFIKDNTKMIWLETPTNPTLKIFDIQKIADHAHKKNILLSVDNTFMSPYFQQPLSLGADIVVHSVTKFINGHSDIIGGAIVVKDKALSEQIAFLSNSIGAIASTFDSYLALRSLKTLAVRMEKHQENALCVANFLEKHERVAKVIYPGLKNHPQHQLACKQMSGFGGVVSFYIKGGVKDACKFLENLKLFFLAESLGGVESLAQHPGIMTHASVPKEQRASLGIDDTLIRLSIGIENKEDLLADISQALG